MRESSRTCFFVSPLCYHSTTKFHFDLDIQSSQSFSFTSSDRSREVGCLFVFFMVIIPFPSSPINPVID
jgi:hypothetical protein